MIVYFGVCIALFGLIFGSFLNCTAMRLVRGEDFVRGRSHCPECGHELSAIELIPVLSFLIQRGRCRHCGCSISPRYIISEVTFSLLSLGLYLWIVFSGNFFETSALLVFFRNWIFTGCLFLVALTDLESYEIFDGVLIFGLINYFSFAIIEVAMGIRDLLSVAKAGLIGFIVGAFMFLLSLLMDRILKRESLGGGDIKLYALLGVYLGAIGSYELVILSCILGLCFAGIRKLVIPGASKEFPFGPAIAFAGYLLLIFEKYITGWYLSLL